jgi:hypothetical protein
MPLHSLEGKRGLVLFLVPTGLSGVKLIDVVNLFHSLPHLQHVSTTIDQVCFQLSESMVCSIYCSMSGSVIMESSTQNLKKIVSNSNNKNGKPTDG